MSESFLLSSDALNPSHIQASSAPTLPSHARFSTASAPPSPPTRRCRSQRSSKSVGRCSRRTARPPRRSSRRTRSHAPSPRQSLMERRESSRCGTHSPEAKKVMLIFFSVPFCSLFILFPSLTCQALALLHGKNSKFSSAVSSMSTPRATRSSSTRSARSSKSRRIRVRDRDRHSLRAHVQVESQQRTSSGSSHYSNHSAREVEVRHLLVTHTNKP